MLIIAEGSGSKLDNTLASASTPLQFDPLSGDRIPKWIAHHSTTALGIGISEPAIELLQAAVGNDLHQLSAGLDKLASFVEGRDGGVGEGAVAAGVRGLRGVAG